MKVVLQLGSLSAQRTQRDFNPLDALCHFRCLRFQLCQGICLAGDFLLQFCTMGELGFLLQQRLAQPGKFFRPIRLTGHQLFMGCAQNRRIDIICHVLDQLVFPAFQNGFLRSGGHAGILHSLLCCFPCGLGLLQFRLGRGITGQLGGSRMMERAAHRTGLPLL